MACLYPDTTGCLHAAAYAIRNFRCNLAPPEKEAKLGTACTQFFAPQETGWDTLLLCTHASVLACAWERPSTPGLGVQYPKVPAVLGHWLLPYPLPLVRVFRPAAPYLVPQVPSPPVRGPATQYPGTKLGCYALCVDPNICAGSRTWITLLYSMQPVANPKTYSSLPGLGNPICTRGPTRHLRNGSPAPY